MRPQWLLLLLVAILLLEATDARKKSSSSRKSSGQGRASRVKPLKTAKTPNSADLRQNAGVQKAISAMKSGSKKQNSNRQQANNPEQIRKEASSMNLNQPGAQPQAGNTFNRPLSPSDLQQPQGQHHQGGYPQQMSQQGPPPGWSQQYGSPQAGQLGAPQQSGQYGNPNPFLMQQGAGGFPQGGFPQGGFPHPGGQPGMPMQYQPQVNPSAPQQPAKKGFLGGLFQPIVPVLSLNGLATSAIAGGSALLGALAPRRTKWGNQYKNGTDAINGTAPNSNETSFNATDMFFPPLMNGTEPQMFNLSSDGNETAFNPLPFQPLVDPYMNGNMSGYQPPPILPYGMFDPRMYANSNNETAPAYPFPYPYGYPYPLYANPFMRPRNESFEVVGPMIAVQPPRAVDSPAPPSEKESGVDGKSSPNEEGSAEIKNSVQTIDEVKNVTKTGVVYQ